MGNITCSGCGAPMFFPQVEGEKYTCACGVGSLNRGFSYLHPASFAVPTTTKTPATIERGKVLDAIAARKAIYQAKCDQCDRATDHGSDRYDRFAHTVEALDILQHEIAAL